MPAPPPSAHVSRALMAGLFVVLLAGALWWGLGRPGGQSDDGAPGARDRWKNTASDVTYIGRAACVACHPGAHATYLETTHSRAFARVDPQHEPPGGLFRHDASGLTYRVYRRGGELRLAEDLPLGDGRREVLADHAMTFVAGSGNHSRTYVLPLDGFLVEAPLTWYARTGRWGMSPGYDVVDHDSFARPVTDECLFCHVGRTERIGRSDQRLRIHEEAIGCERCHGPGSLHVARWRSRPRPDAPGPDPTIVDPRALDREAQLDLCGQCHLDHTLSVSVRGRRMEDWRPGLEMDAFRTTYRLSASSARMSVVGHLDQLRKSRCFQASATMTCLTCHDPHDVPAPDKAQAHYRGRCLTCHEVSGCGLPADGPRRLAEQDDCVHCHMPRSETDIPHFAFTHHRIDVHDGAQGVVDADRVQELVASSDVSHLEPADRDRNLGLAYMLLSVRRPEDPAATSNPPRVVAAYTRRARELLERARRDGASDAAVESTLAFIHERSGDAAQAEARALEALARADADPASRMRALDVLARMYAAFGRHDDAIRLLRQLVTRRRNADDWGRLAASQAATGAHADALTSARTAVSITPHRPRVRRFLAKAYELTGQPERAAEQERLAQVLEARRRR